MPIYQKADLDVCEMVSVVMEKHHGGLFVAEVKIQTLMVYPTTDENGDANGPAITDGGYKVIAKIKILGIKDRIARGFDVELLIDGDNHQMTTEEQQEALIVHELTHIELQIDDNGGVKIDNAGRPKLRTVRHDHQFGWFDSTARRYGDDSVEVMQFKRLIESLEFRQLYLFDSIEMDS